MYLWLVGAAQKIQKNLIKFYILHVKSAIAKMYLLPGLKTRGLLEMYFNLVFFLYQKLESCNSVGRS